VIDPYARHQLFFSRAGWNPGRYASGATNPHPEKDEGEAEGRGWLKGG
jgi:hypothetical protein